MSYISYIRTYFFIACIYSQSAFCVINALRVASRLPARPQIAVCVQPCVKQSVQPHLRHLKIRPDLLEKGDLYFSKTPGYEKLLANIQANLTNPQLLKGYLFELETAIALVEEQQQTVEAFHYNMYNPRSETLRDKREIDILTDRQTVECKYYTWSKVKSNRSMQGKMKNQLIDQHRIITEYNNYYGTRYTQLFCSKNPIPLWWKQFLHDNSIAYKETIASNT